MNTHEVLVKARNKLEHEWAHRTPSGRWVFEGGLGANCASNTIFEVSGSGLTPAHEALRDVLKFSLVSQIFDWNDAPGRTREEVLAAFDEAIAATAPEPADPLAGVDVKQVAREELVA